MKHTHEIRTLNMIHLNPGKCANLNIQYYHSTSDSLDRVIYRTRAHRFDKPQRRISVTDQDHPELGMALPFPAVYIYEIRNFT